MYNRIIYLLLCLLLLVLVSNCSQSITSPSNISDIEASFQKQASDKNTRNYDPEFVPEVDSDKG